jgi:hypothetical protein
MGQAPQAILAAPERRYGILWSQSRFSSEPVSEIPDCVKLFDKLFAKGGTADYTRWADFVDGTDA